MKPERVIEKDGKRYVFQPGVGGSLTAGGVKRYGMGYEAKPSVSKVVPLLKQMRRPLVGAVRG